MRKTKTPNKTRLSTPSPLPRNAPRRPPGALPGPPGRRLSAPELLLDLPKGASQSNKNVLKMFWLRMYAPRGSRTVFSSICQFLLSFGTPPDPQKTPFRLRGVTFFTKSRFSTSEMPLSARDAPKRHPKPIFEYFWTSSGIPGPFPKSTPDPPRHAQDLQKVVQETPEGR